MERLFSWAIYLLGEGKVRVGSCAFIAFILCLLPVSFSLADGGKSELLGLRQAMQLSVKSHPLVAVKKQELQVASGELSAARWAVFPNADFSFRGFRNDDEQNILNQEVLTVSQPIWTGGMLSGTIGAAKAKRDAAKLAIIEVEQKLLGDTARAFIEVYRANSKLDISISNVEEHERLFDIIERRVRAKTSPEVDLRLARARLAFSKSQLFQNQNALEVARADLEQLIGMPVSGVGTPLIANLAEISLAEASKAALAFSPSIRKMQVEIIGLKAMKKVSQSALHPQVSLGYEKRYGELSAGQDDEQYFLGLDFKPGAGLSSRAAIIASEANEEALRASLSALKREVSREVTIAWREYAAAEMQLLPTELLVNSTSDVVRSYLRQYTVGRKSWLDVLNAQRELVQAQQALTDHQAMLILASYRMKILIGKLNSETLGVQGE